MDNLTDFNPYEVLGVSQDASTAEIKRAYFRLVKERFSPERDPEGFKRIRQAFVQLKSEEERSKTDFLLFKKTEQPAHHIDPAAKQDVLSKIDIVDDLIRLEERLAGIV